LATSSPCPASIGVDIGGENIHRRIGRGLATLGGVVDLLAHLGVDAGDCLLAHAKLLEPFAVDLDRIALLPALQLTLRPVLGGIGARMATMAIGQTFDQRRPLACTGLRKGFLRLAIDRVSVVAVDDDFLKAVGRGAIAGRRRHRRHVTNRRVFHVEIVLTDEHHRQLPDGREVQRLVEGADVRRAIAEEADRDVLVALVLRAPGSAAGDRQMRADDGVGAHHAMFGGGEVHRAALAAHQAVVALHQFAEHFFDRDAARQCVRMTSICAERQVTLLHRASKTRRDGFLAERQVAGALHQVLQEEIVGALLGFTNDDLSPIELETLLLADVVVKIGGRHEGPKRLQ
jgi:hypothetical protein